jgi:hypothetical protein
MSRSLSQQSALITDHQSEKAALLSQISGLKTVRIPSHPLFPVHLGFKASLIS